MSHISGIKGRAGAVLEPFSHKIGAVKTERIVGFSLGRALVGLGVVGLEF